MVENEKYYTPEIEEFHAGFECEIQSSWGMQRGTYPDIFKADTLAYATLQKLGAHETLKKYVHSLIVKYLDKEDIESFGFTNFQRVIEDWYKLYKIIECPISHYTYQALRLRHDRPSGGITIIAYEYEHQMEKDQDGVNLFRGIIKNKSEFVVLLKQLNILRDV